MTSIIKIVIGVGLAVVFLLPTSRMLDVFGSNDWRVIAYWTTAELSMWVLACILIIQGIRGIIKR